MIDNLPTLAGTVSTFMFMASTLPMVLKAIRTQDLASYSLGNIATANAGNLVYSVYVFSLPAGPIWVLHSFYLISTAIMLALYLRYAWLPAHRSTDAFRLPVLDTPTGA